MDIYRVEIKNERTGRIFDHYLIKVRPGELEAHKKHVIERYPSHLLSVKFEAK